jgi:tRNA threonylcarbamoyladenosine biosynthesis protein TsaE
MTEIKINSLDQISIAAKSFIEQIQHKKVFAFYGEMGVGKTTFIKSICEQMGVTDTVNSPTFSIINEYTTALGKTIFHFDFYRINSIQEALNFGCEEYLYSGNYCFIEWPEKIESLLPNDCTKVSIIETNTGNRIINLS